MLKGLGGWLRKLIRGDADHGSNAASTHGSITQHAHATGATQVGHVDDERPLTQHLHGSGAIQFGHVGSVQLVHPHPVETSLQALQVRVLQMLDATGDRRTAIEAFMQREFGTNRLSHLSQPQLVRVQRYCEVVEARRGRRSTRSSAKQGDPFL